MLATFFSSDLFGYAKKKKEKKSEDSDNSASHQKEIMIKDVSDENIANEVIILALDKITAKSYTHKIKIDEEMTFGRIIIKPLFCWKTLPHEVPENKVLLKITEKMVDKTEKELFYGWMFSSNPSISSLEHPMYDVTIVDCIKNAKK